MPRSALIDNAIELLPSLLHALQGLPGRAPRIELTPLARSMVLTPLRLPSMALGMWALYVLFVPGYALLVRTRNGFEEGFRVATRASPPSNSLAASGNSPSSSAAAGRGSPGAGGAGGRVSGGLTGDEAALERLRSILAVWSRLIWLVQAARLTAVGIAGLAIVDRLMASHGFQRVPFEAPPPEQSIPPTIIA